MKARFKRHDLVAVSPAARRAFSLVGAGTGSWTPQEADFVAEGVNGVLVPGIVCRQDAAEGAAEDLLCIGFAAPVRRAGVRLRMAATVPRAELSPVCGPYEAALLLPRAPRSALPLFRALRRAVSAASSHGAACGVFGSVALELVTGLPYCHDGSDLDVIVRCLRTERLRALFDELCAVERETGVRVDAELQLGDGSAVKLKEFFSGSTTLLAKAFEGVRLVTWDEAAALNEISEYEDK